MRLLLLLSLVLAVAPAAQITLQTAFPSVSFSSPIELVSAPGDSSRIYVAEQGGRILTLDTDSATPTATTYLNVSTRLTSGGERGLLGMAFHPEYETNGYVYLHYSGSGDGRTVLARYTRSAANPLTADLASEVVLLTVPQPFSNHNGGKLAFGPDSLLYLSLGDGGSGGDPGNRAQNRTTLLGKILRIDTDTTGAAGRPYSIPEDNPYAGNTEGFREEIYAYGIRNAWKFGFDRETGVLWAGDVGQGTWEEVSQIENGGNYGWRIMEGAHCYSPSSGCDQTGLELPVYEYNHSGGRCSITGGTVYRGTANPALIGDYLYADYCDGVVSALSPSPVSGGLVNRTLVNAGFGVIGFGEDAYGEMYVLTQSSGATSVRRIVQQGVATEGTPEAARVAIRLAGPQPFTDATTVSVTADGRARVTLVDALGRIVSVLHDGPVTSSARLAVDGRALAPGVYVVRVEAEGGSAALRIVRAR